MAIRLYDSAWAVVEGHSEPLRVLKDLCNPAAFNVGEYQYDIDARPLNAAIEAPRILRIHSLQSAREAGLQTDYHRR